LSIPESESTAIITRNRDELEPDLKDVSFTKNIVSGVLSRRITLDDIIVRAAPDWPLEKISIIDRNVLRIGLSELLFGDRKQVPPKVAIDEAIELAKTFGGDTSGKFVNGVLGAIYKEMGEPEKTQTTKTKKDYLESGRREFLAGAVVCSEDGGVTHVALVHDVFGYWTLPKGRIENEEKEVEIAAKKIQEEIGIPVVIQQKIGENEYIANKPDQGKIVKHVNYYVARAEFKPLTLEHKEHKGGLDDVRWFSEEDIQELRMYDDIRPLIKKATEDKK
jgi:N utilization substance protein B